MPIDIHLIPVFNKRLINRINHYPAVKAIRGNDVFYINFYLFSRRDPVGVLLLLIVCILRDHIFQLLFKANQFPILFRSQIRDDLLLKAITVEFMATGKDKERFQQQIDLAYRTWFLGTNCNGTITKCLKLGTNTFSCFGRLVHITLLVLDFFVVFLEIGRFGLS